MLQRDYGHKPVIADTQHMSMKRSERKCTARLLNSYIAKDQKRTGIAENAVPVL